MDIRKRAASNYHEYNAQNNIITGEDFTDIPSITAQDSPMTLKQLLARHKAGAPVPILDMQFTEEQEKYISNLPDIDKMSKVELAQLAKDTTEFISQSRKALQAYNEQKQREDAKQQANASPNDVQSEGTDTGTT